jgi:hypothetical protein
MTTDATDEQVQRISEANTWWRGPTDPDWL